MTTKVEYLGDKDVPRQYIEAKPNPMFSELQRLGVLFVRYKTSVPCAACNKRSKYHWTCRVRFRVARDIGFSMRLGRQWFNAGVPVCRNHPTSADNKEMMRKLKGATNAQS